MIEDNIKKLLISEYNIQPNELKKIKNVYKVICSKKNYCFKIIKYDFGHFFFIVSAMQHLQNKNFKNIPEFIKNKDNKIYVNFEDKFAYLTPWIDARECNYSNLDDIDNSILKLAELHIKSNGFIVKKNMNPRIGWFKWIETYETRKKEIEDFKNKINQKENKSEFDSKYLQIMNDEIKRADKSIIDLKNSLYENIMQKQIKGNGFCHHDFANHNVLIDDKNEIYIIDFDYCILDSNIHDISSFLIRVMRNKKWSLKTAKHILDEYSSINYIYEYYIPVISAFIEFPQEYWQIGIQYYWEKQPWSQEKFMNKFNKIFLDREERQNFVNEFKNLKFKS